MLDFSLMPGLLISIGVAGIVYTLLEHFSQLMPNKVDSLSILSGLSTGFIYSIFARSLYTNIPVVTVTIMVVCYSCFGANRKIFKK